MYHHIENCCYICSGGRVAGVVIGVLAACAGIGVGIYCLCTRVLRKKKSADTHGKVIKHEEKTTWNKSKRIYYFKALHAGKLSCFHCRLLTFFKINFF